MTSITVTDELLSGLRDKCVVVTGSQSGMGLAAVKLLLDLGAKVVGGDIQTTGGPGDGYGDSFTFVKTDVTDWVALRTLFKTCADKYGRIDHVFANAGIGPRANFLEDELDENGELKRPDHKTFDINFSAVADSLKLAIHHFKKNPSGGSIVMTGSASSFQRFQVPDYTAAKHGVLGLMRGLYHLTGANSDAKTRINVIAPSWTATGLVPAEFLQKGGLRWQPPEAAARSALYLMAEQSNHGKLIYSVQGKFTELEEQFLADVSKVLDGADSVDPRKESEAEEHNHLLATDFARATANGA